MVTSKILGGLGNQMFQYAVGKNLALKNKTELSLDLNELLNRQTVVDYTLRDFELDVFNIDYKIFKKKDQSRLRSKVSQILCPIIFVKEQNFLYDNEIIKKKGNLYLDGYWQNERYFKDIRNIILQDFTFKTPPNYLNNQLINSIASANSIAVHVRRGDYISNHNANSYHGICTKEYYTNAFNIIKSKVDNPTFFVFSDDLKAAKEILDFESNIVLVDINSNGKNADDLRLMIGCKHNIIANSTFSWWGAWLGTNSDKLVVAPKCWFAKIETDIIPNRWIKV